MKNWNTLTVGEVCDSISEPFNKKSAAVVLINTSDVFDGKCLNHKLVSNSNLKGQFKKSFRKNDILYSEIRPKNKRYAYIDFNATDYVASTKLMVIRAKPNIINPKFLYHFLKSDIMLEQMQAIAESRSGTFPQITFSELSRIEIQIPNIELQYKVVNYLDNLDNKIELNEKINQNLDWEDYFSICHKIIELEEENQNLEAQAQAIFKSWFVDFEPFKNGKFIDSELGKIPEGWTVNTLSNIVYLKKGKKPKELSEIKHENYIPYLTIDALSGGRPLFCDTEKMLLAKEKDILLVMDGASSGAIFYGLDGVVASTIIKLELTNTEVREIVFAFLNYKQLDLKSHTTGSAIPHLDKDRLLSYKIALPSNGKLLRKISGTLTSLRDNIIRNRKESRRLAQLRDTLLPKLMSGEIDVSDVAV